MIPDTDTCSVNCNTTLALPVNGPRRRIRLKSSQHSTVPCRAHERGSIGESLGAYLGRPSTTPAQTHTDLKVTACLGRRHYPCGFKSSPDQIASLRLHRPCPLSFNSKHLVHSGTILRPGRRRSGQCHAAGGSGESRAGHGDPTRTIRSAPLWQRRMNLESDVPGKGVWGRGDSNLACKALALFRSTPAVSGCPPRERVYGQGFALLLVAYRVEQRFVDMGMRRFEHSRSER